MARVTVFHNVADREAMPMLYGYKAEHPITPVFQFQTMKVGTAACEEAFFLFNVGDDAAFNTEPNTIYIAVEYRKRKLRSMSVGDVVKVEDAWYACGAVGFDPIEAPADSVVSGIEIHGTHSLELQP